MARRLLRRCRIAALAIWVSGCQLVFSLDEPPPEDAPQDAPVDTPRCGVVGSACCEDTAAPCGDGSLCLDDGAGARRCAVFAGAFELTQADGCAPASCQSGDALNGDACACPPGFATESAVVDGGCGDPHAPQHHSSTVKMCVPAVSPPIADWAGWYLTSDPTNPACFPDFPDFCLSPNPLTGGCSCPARAESIRLRTLVPTQACGVSVGGFLVVCRDREAPVGSLVGVFELAPDGMCISRSSELASCACPAGAIESHLKTMTDLGANGFLQSTTTFCLAVR